MYGLRIKSIGKQYFQAQNEEVMQVEFEILDGQKVVEFFRQAFPLETTKEEITEAMNKFIATYNEDAQAKVKSDKRETAESEMKNTEKDLSKVVFKPEEPKSKGKKQ